jgi:hypothetical protein
MVRDLKTANGDRHEREGRTKQSQQTTLADTSGKGAIDVAVVTLSTSLTGTVAGKRPGFWPTWGASRRRRAVRGVVTGRSPMWLTSR